MKLIEFFNDSPITPPSSFLLERDQIELGQLSLETDIQTEGDSWVHLSVYQNNEMIGELTVDNGEILWIHVEPDYRRIGLGTKMVQYLRTKGYPVVHSKSLTPQGQAFVGGLSKKGELDEVESISSFGDEPDQVHHYTKFSKKFNTQHDVHIGDIDNASIYVRRDLPNWGTREFFIISDETDEPAGYARGSFGEIDGHRFVSVIMIWINQEYRGQGLARGFYTFLLEDLGLMLISDKQQTSDAQSIWMWLAEQYQTVLLNKYNIVGEVNSVDDFFSAYNVPGEEYDLRLGIIPKKRTTPLKEVIRLGSMDWQYDNTKANMLQTYERKKESLEKFGMLNGYELWFEVVTSDKQDNARIYLIKPGDTEPSGFAVIRPMGKMTMKIGMIWFARDLRKRGLGFKLYELFLNQGYRIVSDLAQTPNSMSIWKRLIQKYEASLIENDKKIADIDSLNDLEQVYTNNSSILMMVYPKQRSEPLTESRGDLSQTAVVDENGDPLMVYHIGVGSHRTRFHPLSHFGTDEAANQRMKNIQARIKKVWKDYIRPDDMARFNFAQSYLDKYYFGKKFHRFAVYLDIRNPLEIRDSPNTMHNSLVLLGELTRKGLLDKETYHRLAGFSSDEERMKVLKKTMKQHGYDGFVYENRQEDRGSRSWIILDPSQVHIVERKAVEGLNEYIRKGEAAGGLLYRWVEPKKAFSNLDTNSLYPGKWTHNIPTVGNVAGVSFGYNPGQWKPNERAVGFVLDRSKLNPKKIIDIPGHEVYSYSVGAEGSISPEHMAKAKDDILSPDVEPDEAFYVGIIRPLSKSLERIIVKGDLPPKLLRLIYIYSERHGIPVYDEDGTPHEGQHDHFNNPALKESIPDYDYSRMSGFWIDDEGNVHEVDHDEDIHHDDVIMNSFLTVGNPYVDREDFENESGEVSDHIIDHLIDVALNTGWVRVSTFNIHRMGNIVIETHNPAPAALSTLIRWMVDLHSGYRYSFYPVPHYQEHLSRLDKAGLIDALERAFPKQTRKALRMMNESAFINEDHEAVRSLHKKLPGWGLVPFGTPGEFHGYLYDTYVEGEGEPGRFFNIYSWHSEEPGKGNTENALKLLKRVYGTVVAHGIGTESTDKSWTYWVHMLRKGLVDEITDDNGFVVKPSSITEDEGEFDWSKPITFYRGVVDPSHAEKPFAGTRRGLPAFTDTWHIANVYAQSPNDVVRDKGKSDRVYAYKLNIKNPLLLNAGREDVTEANYIFKKLGAQSVEEAWKMFVPLYRRMDSWRTDGGMTFKEEVEFPLEIEGFAGFPDKTYNSMKEIFIDNWEQDFPGFYCTSYELADDSLFQEMVKRSEYDGIVMYGHTTLFAYDDDIFTGTSFDGITAMEWRALYPEQIEYLGPADNPTGKEAVEPYQMNETPDESLRSLYNALDELNPDDVGQLLHGPYILAFEGFTDVCWEDFYNRSDLETVEDVKKEVLSDWVSRNPGFSVMEYGWKTGDGEACQDDVFWAILKKDITKNSNKPTHETINEISQKPWLRVTPTMIQQAKGNKCQVIVEMPATQFLYMTTFPQKTGYPTMDHIMQQAKPLRSYNRWAKIGHDRDFGDKVNMGRKRGSEEYEYGTILMPMLRINLDNDGTTGRIVGHEGRHRAAAAIKHGDGRIRVALCIRPGQDMFPDVMFGVEYHITAEHLPKYVEGQVDGHMYSTRDWKVIEADMQAGVRGSGQ